MSRRVNLCSLALFQKGCWASRGIRPSPEPCPPAPPARSMRTLNQNNARHGTQQAQQQHTQYTFSPGFPTASCPLHAHSLGSTVLHMPDDASSHDMATHSSTSTPPSCYSCYVTRQSSAVSSRSRQPRSDSAAAARSPAMRCMDAQFREACVTRVRTHSTSSGLLSTHTHRRGSARHMHTHIHRRGSARHSLLLVRMLQAV